MVEFLILKPSENNSSLQDNIKNDIRAINTNTFMSFVNTDTNRVSKIMEFLDHKYFVSARVNEYKS